MTISARRNCASCLGISCTALCAVIALPVRKSDQRVHFQDGDGVTPDNRYDPAAGKLGDSPRDGFDRHAQIVGNIEPCHRQFDDRAPVLRLAACHHQQETGHFFLGTPTRQKNHLILGGRHLVAEAGEKLLPQMWRSRAFAFETTPRKAPQFDVGDGFHRVEVVLLDGDAE
nr:lcrD [Rhizobium sp.]